MTLLPELSVGHHHRITSGWATGVTVVLTPPGCVGAVDVRGAAPGTRETDLLEPGNLVQHVDAVVLCGGSAYGLAAADGVMSWLAARHRGFRVGAEPHEVVPIVPAAVLFDLPLSSWGHVPDASFGVAACEAAGSSFDVGSVGAGAGATAGPLKGGVGAASVTVGECTVGALVAANPSGSVVDVATGLPYVDVGLRAPSASDLASAAAVLRERPAGTSFNTTIGVVATDAALDRPQARRLAMAAHDGLARAVRPAHTPFDGDTVFALATGSRPGSVDPATLAALCAAAADVFALAVAKAVVSATSVAGVPCYRELWPSALGMTG